MRKGFWFIFKNEITYLFTNRRLMLLVFGVPMFLFMFYASLLSQGVPHDMPITLLDNDKSKLSRQLAFMIDGSKSMSIDYVVSDELEGQKTIRRGDSFAMIVIPKDFQKNASKGLQTNVTCYYNSQYLLPSSLIKKDFQLISSTLAAQIRVVSLMQNEQGMQQALNTIMPVNSEVHTLFNPYTSYSYYLNLAMMPMAFQIIIMVVSVYVFNLVLKQKKGKELLEQANDSMYVAIFAKILPYTLVFTILGVFMNSLIFYQLGMPFKGSFLGINVLFFVFVLVCHSMALFITVLFSKKSIGLGVDFAALAFSFAGYTFPPEGMNSFMQGFSYIFPFHAYMRYMVNYAIKGISYNADQRAYLIALAVFIVIGIVSMLLYYKKLKKGGYDVE